MITARLLGLLKPGYARGTGALSGAPTAEDGNGPHVSQTQDVPIAPARPYSKTMDTPEQQPASRERIPDALRALLKEDEDGAVMVTTWATVCEYIDENGTANVAAWASDDPPWRVGGLLSVAQELLDVSTYDMEYDDLDEDD